MSTTPIAITGAIIIKLNKKYGLIKLRSKTNAIDTIDDVMKICLTLIFLDFGRLDEPFYFCPELSLRAIFTYLKGENTC